MPLVALCQQGTRVHVPQCAQHRHPMAWLKLVVKLEEHSVVFFGLSTSSGRWEEDKNLSHIVQLGKLNVD